ncbi:hypothetical protein PAPYR_9946 [Paratrimastix pyriformis]|uniref:Uncharacterized protein n=1 Tax=Paratrimastix pyriformis TaxID=342808 RepID=A0ABQ8U9Q6_9EUKA|nr:hypothetical protein PAPYR_9946 [Paratrimastix pyriformis]
MKDLWLQAGIVFFSSEAFMFVEKRTINNYCNPVEAYRIFEAWCLFSLVLLPVPLPDMNVTEAALEKPQGHPAEAAPAYCLSSRPAALQGCICARFFHKILPSSTPFHSTPSFPYGSVATTWGGRCFDHHVTSSPLPPLGFARALSHILFCDVVAISTAPPSMDLLEAALRSEMHKLALEMPISTDPLQNPLDPRIMELMEEAVTEKTRRFEADLAQARETVYSVATRQQSERLCLEGVICRLEQEKEAATAVLHQSLAAAQEGLAAQQAERARAQAELARLRSQAIEQPPFSRPELPALPEDLNQLLIQLEQEILARAATRTAQQVSAAEEQRALSDARRAVAEQELASLRGLLLAREAEGHQWAVLHEEHCLGWTALKHQVALERDAHLHTQAVLASRQHDLEEAHLLADSQTAMAQKEAQAHECTQRQAAADMAAYEHDRALWLASGEEAAGHLQVLQTELDAQQRRVQTLEELLESQQRLSVGALMAHESRDPSAEPESGQAALPEAELALLEQGHHYEEHLGRVLSSAQQAIDEQWERVTRQLATWQAQVEETRAADWKRWGAALTQAETRREQQARQCARLDKEVEFLRASRHQGLLEAELARLRLQRAQTEIQLLQQQVAQLGGVPRAVPSTCHPSPPAGSQLPGPPPVPPPPAAQLGQDGDPSDAVPDAECAAPPPIELPLPLPLPPLPPRPLVALAAPPLPPSLLPAAYLAALRHPLGLAQPAGDPRTPGRSGANEGELSCPPHSPQPSPRDMVVAPVTPPPPDVPPTAAADPSAPMGTECHSPSSPDLSSASPSPDRTPPPAQEPPPLPRPQPPERDSQTLAPLLGASLAALVSLLQERRKQAPVDAAQPPAATSGHAVSDETAAPEGSPAPLPCTPNVLSHPSPAGCGHPVEATTSPGDGGTGEFGSPPTARSFSPPLTAGLPDEPPELSLRDIETSTRQLESMLLQRALGGDPAEIAAAESALGGPSLVDSIRSDPEECRAIAEEYAAQGIQFPLQI